MNGLMTVDRFKKFLGVTANILLTVIVVVTCVDVIGRYFLAAPLLGAHEIITLAMGMMIYLGMPLVTAAKEHLVVDLASSFLSPRIRRIQQIIVNSISALTLLLFSYLLFEYGVGLAEDQMITEDFEIEQATIAFLMAVMCFMTIFGFIFQIYQEFQNKYSEQRKKLGPKN